MRRILITLGMVLGLQATLSLAQDMRVYTTVSRQGTDGVWEPYSHSLTLFHSGKVYDFMEEVGVGAAGTPSTFYFASPFFS